MSTGQKLHIISFDIPIPADYGGVIDVFYKIKSLAKAGVYITLHCFQYGRPEAQELKKYCEKVYYYPRAKGLFYALKKQPYIVATRNSPALLKNLLTDNSPILFEGLHSCYFLAHPELATRKKNLRMHNVEQDYYRHLSKAEPNVFKRIYFRNESTKLKRFEQVISHADLLVTISPSDQEYFKNIHQQVKLIPAFHQFEEVKSKSGSGGYFLFHGNLSVSENLKAVNFLLDEVFTPGEIPLVVAGKNPPQKLLRKVGGIPNVKIIAAPLPQQMDELIMNAQGCVIPSFQSTGLKLKLLVSLYSGRFCITNPPVVANTGLEKLCIVADTATQMQEAVKNIAGKVFSEKNIEARKHILEDKFSNKSNAERLINLIWNHPV